MRRSILLLVLLVLLAVPAAADEVVLTSGGVLSGTVESADEREVAVRTPLGLVRVPRDRVADIRREAASPEPPAPRGLVAEPVFSRDGIDPAVAPASTGALVAVALVAGEVAALDPRTGETAWSAAPVSGRIAGFAADTSGIWLSTEDGHVERLDPRNGRRLWSVRAAGRLDQPPLVTRRGVFVFSPEEGLVGIEPSTGTRRGALLLPDFVPDTPLAATEDTIFVGEASGAIAAFAADGTASRGYFETGERWNGAAVAFSSRRAIVRSQDRLVLLDESAAEGRALPVAGLSAHPLGADPVRVYVAQGGAPAAVDLRTGRVLWRNDGAGRVTHLTVEGTRLLAVTSDQRLVGLSPSAGGVLFAADLGAPAASAPVSFGDRLLVVTTDGRCAGFAVRATSAVPAILPDEPPVFRSPDGYRFDRPAGWAICESTIRAEISVTMRPAPANAPPDWADLAEVDRNLLVAQSEIAVRVLPSEGTPAPEFREVPVRRLDPGRARREAVRQLDAHRLVAVSFVCPMALRAAAEPGLETILRSFAPDQGDRIEEVVVAAEAVLEALNCADLEPALDRLGDALWKTAGAGKPKMGGVTYRLLDRQSRAAGRFRRVRVRIDDAAGTRFADLLLGIEGGRAVVTDWSGLR